MVTVKWRCKHCGTWHRWKWSEYDCIDGAVHMHCDKCKMITKMPMHTNLAGEYVPAKSTNGKR